MSGIAKCEPSGGDYGCSPLGEELLPLGMKRETGPLRYI